MKLLPRIRRKIARLLGLPEAPHWTQQAQRLDFRSGLGDSAWLLYAFCRSMKPAVCVEIGSARGKSACYIGAALKENGRGVLYAIDPHAPTDWNDTESVDTLSLITRHLDTLGLQPPVEIVRMTSDRAAAGWTRKIDLLFIDGDHSYEGVKRDWELFSPFLSEDGVVVFHDTLWDLMTDRTLARADMGVPRFVESLRAAGYPVITFGQDYGVSIVQPVIGGKKLRVPTPDGTAA